MKTNVLLLFIIVTILTASGCGQQEQAQELDYEQSKKMIVDILKTDEGKKAIQDIMSEDGMKQQLIMDQTIVTAAIEKSLTSKEATDFWKESLSDPEFAESFAKGLQEEQEKLIKELMKDPEYQGMMLELFQNPEMEQQTLTVLKGKEYRTHLQKVITETIESPLFKVKIQEILLKGAEELQSGEKGDDEEQSADNEEGGDDSGGNGGGG
ncbi:MULTISPECIES: spore germination lipoprotein GerD [Bacillaceae]|uniref:spore germination lipoprotein GerD n=1 Tax=Bacillaceae TaxID=186817 RepID=UPI002A155140|nr:spore germination lipoprotein GerD [Cytobacillus sp. IB215316]MDX8363038.1 spore germination lipoprotein GerD [Cytobacillus sp. IB215316]